MKYDFFLNNLPTNDFEIISQKYNAKENTSNTTWFIQMEVWKTKRKLHTDVINKVIFV